VESGSIASHGSLHSTDDVTAASSAAVARTANDASNDVTSFSIRRPQVQVVVVVDVIVLCILVVVIAVVVVIVDLQ